MDIYDPKNPSLADAMAQVEEYMSRFDRSEIVENHWIRQQIKEAYTDLVSIINLTTVTHEQRRDMSTEELKRNGDIFCGIEAAMMLLSNWIPHETIKEIKLEYKDA